MRYSEYGARGRTLSAVTVHADESCEGLRGGQKMGEEKW